MVHAALAFFLLWSGHSHATECGGLLLNAEPFGFGPAAAIAQVAPKLRSHAIQLGYFGEGHTLDLQRGLPYEDLITSPLGAADATISLQMSGLRKTYSHFVTATDFRFARLAKAAGFEVAVYDPLLWYWQSLPPELANVDLYLVQDFIGVADRLKSRALPAQTHLVPPLSRALNRIADGPDKTLINLGGLQNPFFDKSLLTALAGLLIEECRRASSTPHIEIATNSVIAHAYPIAKTFTPALIAQALEQSTLAYMTSGLGNLIEASSASTPVVWLPPTNDSQGQQIEKLARAGMIDARVDWNDFDDLPPINYFRPQPFVMREIKERMNNLIHSPVAQLRLRQALSAQSQNLMRKKRADLKIRRLVDEYGQGGVEILVEHIRTWANAR